MEHLKSKLVKERTELVDKITKLEKFKESDTYPELGKPQQLAILSQLNAMRDYAYALGKRIEMAEPDTGIEIAAKRVLDNPWPPPPSDDEILGIAFEALKVAHYSLKYSEGIDDAYNQVDAAAKIT